jgi:hypothetical protein
MQEKEPVGILLLMPRFNAWASDGRVWEHVHHLDSSMTVWAESTAYMAEAWQLRPDDVVLGVEELWATSLPSGRAPSKLPSRDISSEP